MSEEELEKALDEIFKEDIEIIRERMKVLMRGYDKALTKLVEKDKVIDLMASEIAKLSGTCPFDSYDWCNKSAEDCFIEDIDKCYIEYFYKKAEEENEH